MATVGLVVVLFWIVIGIISIFWTSYPPNAQEFLQNLPPNSVNWLGTDHLGRDIASRLMAGTQVILLKTRLPDFTLAGMMRFLAMTFGFVSLFIYVLVLARMFLVKGFHGDFSASSQSSRSSGAGKVTPTRACGNK